MSDEPFGRQPLPVTLTFSGDPRDIDHYKRRIKNWIESVSYDVTTSPGDDTLVIHPRAVNE